MPHGETGLDRPVCTPRRVRISLNWLVMMSMSQICDVDNRQQVWAGRE